MTHLPQIAAHADAHYRIAKRERDGRTVTEVEHLDREGRIVELAQMLGGEAGGAGDAGQRPRAARPRGGLARRGRAGPADDRPHDVPDLDRAIDDYLTYLRVERGLAPATIRAYRGDLHDFAASRGAAARWATLAGRRPSATSRRGRGAAGRTTRASPRPACGVGRPRSGASTGSPTARA